MGQADHRSDCLVDGRRVHSPSTSRLQDLERPHKLHPAQASLALPLLGGLVKQLGDSEALAARLRLQRLLPPRLASMLQRRWQGRPLGLEERPHPRDSVVQTPLLHHLAPPLPLSLGRCLLLLLLQRQQRWGSLGQRRAAFSDRQLNIRALAQACLDYPLHQHSEERLCLGQQQLRWQVGHSHLRRSSSRQACLGLLQLPTHSQASSNSSSSCCSALKDRSVICLWVTTVCFACMWCYSLSLCMQ